MNPDLVGLRGWTLATLPTAFAAGATTATIWSLRRAARFGLEEHVVVDVALIAGVTFLLGGRVLYMAVHWATVRHSITGFMAFREGGISGFGGVLLATAAGCLYAQRRSISVSRLATIVSPPLFGALAITRIGCFANGCCAGKPTTGPLGVRVSRVTWTTSDVMIGQRWDTRLHAVTTTWERVHPTQLYEATGALLCLVLLLILERRGTSPRGVMSVAFLLVGLLRVLVDPFRAYDAAELLFGLPVSSLIGMVFVGTGVALAAGGRMVCRPGL